VDGLRARPAEPLADLGGGQCAFAELVERLLPADVVHLPGGDVGELPGVGGGGVEDRLEHRGEGRLSGGPLSSSGGEGVGGLRHAGSLPTRLRD
jgi:hypothetical protein